MPTLVEVQRNFSVTAIINSVVPQTNILEGTKGIKLNIDKAKPLLFLFLIKYKNYIWLSLYNFKSS